MAPAEVGASATKEIPDDGNKNINAKVPAQRERTKTAPAMPTANKKLPKEKKAFLTPSSTKKSLWKRKPKPAHSGVPVPEKMKKLLEKKLISFNDSL